MGIGNGIGVSWGKVSMARGPVVNEAFEFTVKTDNAGTSAANQFTIPITSATPYDISTSDGHNITGATGATTLTFSATGTYTVKITESCEGWKFNLGGDRLKLLDISNWGVYANTAIGSFYGASNMTCSAVDVPIGIHTTLQGAFQSCSNFNGAIGNWDVSNVTNMSAIFSSATSFNQDISAWDVSSVNNMTSMFNGATSFNRDLNTWNTSNVTSMAEMFRNNPGFNSNITTWDVSSVTSFQNMFLNQGSTGVFNQDISGWNVSSATNFLNMFFNTNFNQPIGSWSINTTSSVNMAQMFLNATQFNQPIGSWDVSSVTNMAGMFGNADAFNQDLSTWNTSNVTTMREMFLSKGMASLATKGTTPIETSINSWDVSNVTDMYRMFESIGFGNPDITNWNTQSVQNFQRFMQSSGHFNRNLGGWNTSSATNMSAMFGYDRAQPGSISSWDIDQVTNFTNFMTNNLTALSTADYDAVLVSWENQLQIAYPGGAGYTPVISINFGVSTYTLGGEVEAARTSLINTYGWTITDGGGVAEVPFVFDATPFAGAGTVTIKTQTGFTYDYDVSVSTGESFTNQTGDLVMTFGDNVTRTFTVSGLFPGFKCESDASARFQVQTWGSQLWRSLYAAFWHPNFTLTSVGSDTPNLLFCDSLERTFSSVTSFPASNNLSQWNTSQVKNFSSCFRDATGGLNNIDITNWDTGKATQMADMFSGNASDWSLTSTDVSQWNTRNVTTFRSMFYNNYTFNQPIQNWDVRSASGNAFQAFLYNSTTNLGQFNQPVGSWNLNPSNYGSNFFRAMFYGQNAFDQDLSAWTITGLPNAGGNFNDFITNADLVARPMSFSRANYDKLLISWGNQGFVYAETISFGDAQYTLGGAAEAARNTLVNTYGWTITDGGGIAPPLLDTYTGAAAAYSLRDLSSSTTNVIRVRRSSDNTEQDFTSTQVADGTLTTFVGAGNDGFVTVWYDQSGNNNDATQTNTAQQPIVVLSGVLVTEGGVPMIDYTTTQGKTLILTTPVAYSNSVYTFFGNGTKESSSDAAFLGGGSGSFEFRFGTASRVTALRQSQQNLGGLTIPTNTGHYAVSCRVNQTRPEYVANTTSGNGFSAGNFTQPVSIVGNANGEDFEGKMGDWILYDTDQWTNQAAIQANINSYYTIY